ncbi:Peptidoglycan-binding protein, CsiV [compost metagenome]|uniref:Peptidoglycan-binding protein, CsiV n=1 Tax=Pseudomonas jinjuensis TaxID=198616 RepID=A0A1H0PGP0_9PSED|nr:CsiV family protein [Pseudomonas jinjuensis]SDP03940.1 Peptidoglycan-binding protein, CsiV [Pseudomonas jinjuensis]
MRLFRPLLALLALLAPMAFADEPYQVELILFQQAGDPVFASQPAPDDWARGAPAPGEDARRPTALDAQAHKLEEAQGFVVLMHKAWRQEIGANPVTISLNEGKQQDGHFPVEGTLTLSQERFVDAKTDFWVNRFGDDGLLARSQRMVQDVRLKNSVLAYLDHPSLGMLIKVSPLNARPASPNPAELEEQQIQQQEQQAPDAAPPSGGFDAPPPSAPVEGEPAPSTQDE